MNLEEIWKWLKGKRNTFFAEAATAFVLIAVLGVAGITAGRSGIAKSSEVESVRAKAEANKVEEQEQENAEKNHVSIGRGLCGDALRDEKLAADIGSGYSVIVANIVADVIIGMAPMFFAKTAEGGTLICSGILNERADEVRAALEKAGFEVVNHAKSDDWSAFTAKK